MKKPKKEKLPDDVCPTHNRKLIPTKTTGQLVCPDYTCDFWRKKK
jgi:hypothetical protein